jgi:hypothetical protein
MWSSVHEPGHSQYLALRTTQDLKVYMASRSPNGIAIQENFSVPVPSNVNTSVAFSQGDLAVSYWMPINAQGDSVSPAPFDSVRFFRLSDGVENTARSQYLGHDSLLPPKQTSAPFYTSNWALSSWQQPICNGSVTPNAQHGRAIGATADKMFVAFPGEQINACNPNPNYYQYHLLPSGQPEMQIVRVGTNSLGQPSGLPVCDVVPGFPTVAQCVGTLQDTCQPLNSSGTPLVISGACQLRYEPRPVLAFEHCPTCPYYWSVLDPGSLILQGPNSAAMNLVSRVPFPSDPIPADANDPSILGLPPARIQLGAITQVVADPLGSGYAITAELSSPSIGLGNYGGLLFFDPQGNYLGLGTTLVRDSHVGENGSVSVIGRGPDSRTVYAVGSPRNRPRGPGGWNLPPGELPEFKPEAGHVAYYTFDGERHGFDFGDQPDELFGTSVSGLGDINADLSPDLLVGAPGGNYAAMLTPIESPITGQRGAMFYFNGPIGSSFGKQVAALDTRSQNRADIALVASDNAVYIYDIMGCSTALSPAVESRDELKTLVEPLLAKAQAITPNHTGKIPKIKSPLNPAHPHLKGITKALPKFLEVLTSSPIILPSNEAVRAEDLSRATTALNINMNYRDITRSKISSLNKKYKTEKQLCKQAKKKKTNSHCKKKAQLLQQIAKENQNKADAIQAIQVAKDIVVNNLLEIRNELP